MYRFPIEAWKNQIILNFRVREAEKKEKTINCAKNTKKQIHVESRSSPDRSKTPDRPNKHFETFLKIKTLFSPFF